MIDAYCSASSEKDAYLQLIRWCDRKGYKVGFNSKDFYYLQKENMIGELDIKMGKIINIYHMGDNVFEENFKDYYLNTFIWKKSKNKYLKFT